MHCAILNQPLPHYSLAWSYSDVVIDSKTAPNIVILHIEQSKTDSLWESTHVVLR